MEREPALAPLIDNAIGEVEGLAGGKVALTAEARRGLGGWLGERLEIATRAVLLAEGARGRELDGGDWARIFARYPELVPIVERLIVEWRDGVARFVARYADDAGHLGEPEAPALRSVAVVGGGWKRSPTLRCVTGGGQAIYYKDHTLEIGAWLMELVWRLNECGLPLPLHVRRISARAGYGWDDEVVAAPCRSVGEAERYYVRIGMWIRLLQILGANDMHAKNLIAAGEHPVPIDHENLFQPARADGRSALGLARRARQRSPLECGILPYLLVGEPGRRAVNAGGLEVGGDYLLPFSTPEGYPPIRLPRTLPTVAGQVIEARAQVEAIVGGYQAMHAVVNGPDAEREVEQMLVRASACEVRVLRRPAHVTRRLIVESLQPAVLAKPGGRATFLAKRAHPHDKEALIALEVPRQYEGPTLSVVARVRTNEELAWDRACIATAIGCAEAARGDLVKAAGPAVGADIASEPGGANELVRRAVALGDRILDEGFGDTTALHWLGVRWSPEAAGAAIEVLPSDLLSGNAGLAVALAALYRVSGIERFADGARRALSPVEQALKARSPGEWRPWGAYLGWAGQVYALERVAELIGATPPTIALEPLLSGGSGGVDLACGTAGLIAVVTREGRARPPWLSALAEVLRRARREGYPPLPYPDGITPAYLPDAATSVSFALARVGDEEAGAVDLDAYDVGDAASLVRRAEQSNSWFPDSGLADRLNLGAMRGLGAVVLALLRAAAPEARIPSLWRLD